MLNSWLIVDFRECAQLVAAAYAATLLVLVSLLGSLPSKKRERFRAASRTFGIFVAVSGLLLIGIYVEQWSFATHAFRPYPWVAWSIAFLATLCPQLLWLPWIRKRMSVAICIALFALAGHSAIYVIYRTATLPPGEIPLTWRELFWALF